MARTAAPAPGADVTAGSSISSVVVPVVLSAFVFFSAFARQLVGPEAEDVVEDEVLVAGVEAAFQGAGAEVGAVVDDAAYGPALVLAALQVPVGGLPEVVGVPVRVVDRDRGGDRYRVGSGFGVQGAAGADRSVDGRCSRMWRTSMIRAATEAVPFVLPYPARGDQGAGGEREVGPGTITHVGEQGFDQASFRETGQRGEGFVDGVVWVVEKRESGVDRVVAFGDYNLEREWRRRPVASRGTPIGRA